MRFLQASSAEIFGDPASSPQTEDTPIAPVTPYGAAKAFAHSMVRVYRQRGMFATTAVLYNHESPRRPQSFVAAKIAAGSPRSPPGGARSSPSATSTSAATGATPPTTPRR